MLQKRDKWLSVLLIAIPIVLTLIFLVHNGDEFYYSSLDVGIESNLITGAVVSEEPSNELVIDPINDTFLNESFEEMNQPHGDIVISATSIAPVVNLISPANLSVNITTYSPDFFFNASDVDNSTLNCTLYAYNFSGFSTQKLGFNSSVTNNTTTFIKPIPELSNGNYTWWVNCSDGVNENTTEQRNLTIDLDECQTIDGPRTFKGATVFAQPNQDCFIVNVSNITIDFNGTVIVPTDNSSNTSINALRVGGGNFSLYNVSIYNVNVSGFRTEIESSNNGVINFENISIKQLKNMDTKFGLRISGSNNTSVKNLFVYGGNKSISVEFSSNTTISNFTIYPAANNSESISEHSSIFIMESEDTKLINGNITRTDVPDAYLKLQNGKPSYFINVSMNITNSFTGSRSPLYRQWFVDVNVSNDTGSPVSGAIVKGFNTLNTLDGSLFSDPDNGIKITETNGFAQLILTEYYFEADTIYYVSPNHTIKVNNQNYTSNQTILDLFNKTGALVNVSIREHQCADRIISNLEVGKETNCTSSYVNVSKDNLEIQGNDFLIKGELIYDGFIASGVNNLVLNNSIFTNFSTGINLTNSNNSRFYLLNLTNNSIEMVFNNSNNNTIYNSDIENATSFAIYTTSTDKTVNCFINSNISLSNITRIGNAEICKGWFLTVNVTLPTGDPLPNANVLAYFNGTSELDASGVTGGDGLVILDVTEQVLNSTGIITKGAHNITANFTSITGLVNNSTIITVTGNNVTQLTLDIDCVVPTDDLILVNNTTFCPGTYTLTDVDNDGLIKVQNSSVNIICDQTIISGGQTTSQSMIGDGVFIDSHHNISIDGCTFGYFNNGLKVINSSNFSITNSTIIGNNNGINFLSIETANVSFSTVESNIQGIVFALGSNSSKIFNNTFQKNLFGSITSNFGETLFVNSGQNFIYNNLFNASIDVSHEGQNNSVADEFKNFFNFTVNGTNVGNFWYNICDLGLEDDFIDSNSDGVYDSGSKYPYNNTQITEITETDFISFGLDYYPYVVSCQVAEVLLSSSSSSTSSTATTSGDAPASTESAPASAGASSVVAVSSDSGSSVLGTFTAKEAGAYKIEPSLDLNQYTDLITKLQGLGYSQEEFIRQAIRILILDQQDFSLAYKQIYSFLGTFSPKSIISKFGGITILDSFSALAFDIENKQLDLDTGDTIDLDFTFDIPGTKNIILPASVTFEGNELKQVEMTARPNSEKGVFVKIDSNSHIGEAIIVIPITDENSVDQQEYAIEFSFNKKNTPAGRVFHSYNYLFNFDESTHAVGHIDAIKVKANEGGLFGFDFIYDPKVMQGDYIFRSSISMNGKEVSKNKFELVFE